MHARELFTIRSTTSIMLLLILFLGVIGTYCYFLNKRFNTPHPAGFAFTTKPLSEDELSKLTYPTPEDMVNAMKAAGPATGKAYVVLGGSGLVGRFIVRSLLGRGETLVRNIDITPPDLSGDPNAVDHVSRAEFIRADVTNYETVKDALSRSFGGTGITAQVIIHTVGVIRHWERLPYLKHLCHDVNVGGTKNVLKIAQALGSVHAFVFTSSVTAVVPPVKYLRLWSRNPPVFRDEPIKGATLSNNHYPTSKREADALVRAADNVKGIRTGVLRPGTSITGPGDQHVTVFFRNKGIIPIWGEGFLQSISNPWDIARAHIQYADALENRPDEIAGKGFLLTGNPTPMRFGDGNRVIQFYCNHNIKFQPMPAIFFYALAHLMELFFLARYYVLRVVSMFTGTKVSFVPQWAIDSNAVLLQPATWDFAFADYIVDDNKVRKLLG
ncbi:hypothetical protein FRC07_011183 [Ceratobasidium sp. 392]|nr:hypothetical protein FRC07_011183 [Ceratobasidium sp. 392]